MNFWDSVDILLGSKGLTRKELASYANIHVSSIAKGKLSETSPSAETAVKIAKFLGTSVEFLVTGEYCDKIIGTQELQELFKYSEIIKKISILPDEKKEAILKFIFALINFDEYLVESLPYLS